MKRLATVIIFGLFVLSCSESNDPLVSCQINCMAITNISNNSPDFGYSDSWRDPWYRD